MPHILVNGISAKAGGGKSILNNFLMLLSQAKIKDNYFILTPNREEYLKYSTTHIHIIDVGSSWKKTVSAPFLYYFKFETLIAKLKINLILNFADIIIPVKTPQIYLFDWAYAVYPDSVVWAKMEFKEWVVRKLKIALIKKYIQSVKVVLAQTNVTKHRLQQIYSISKVEVVPNAVSIDNLSGGIYKNFNLPSGKTKFLYLTKYYSHKNIEIFIPLAKKIRSLGLPYVLIITIDEKQHHNAKKLIEKITSENLESIIINIGAVEMENVPALYQQSDALLMPTLLESFSGTYVEAMFHKKIIFTSNFDFAKEVCGDAAFYFDPLDAESILSTISNAYLDNSILEKKTLASERLKQFLNWEEVFALYMQTIDRYKY